MSFQATLKGVVAQVIGGMGNVPGAIAGSLLLGLTESFGVGAVRLVLPQPVRLRAAAAHPGAAAERAVRRPPVDAAGAADGHLHRAQPAVACPARGSWPHGDGGGAAAAGAQHRLCAAGADQRVAVRDAGRQPDAGGGHAGPGLAGACRAAADRGVCLGAAGAGLRLGRCGSACRRPGVLTAADRHGADLARRSGCARTTCRSPRSGSARSWGW